MLIKVLNKINAMIFNTMINIICCIIHHLPLLLFLMYFYYIVGLTWIHEMGHVFVVWIYSKLHKLKFPTHVVINIYSCKESNGKTYSDAYEKMEGHKLTIQINSLAGIVTEFVCTSLIVYAILKLDFPQCYTLSFVAPLLSSLLSAYREHIKPNNDLYIFRHPEQFKYDPNFKK